MKITIEGSLREGFKTTLTELIAKTLTENHYDFVINDDSLDPIGVEDDIVFDYIEDTLRRIK
jgi:hypothetical protein